MTPVIFMMPFMVHIPKTGTTSISYHLRNCNMSSSPQQMSAIKHHHKIYRNTYIVATLRDPVKRMESLLSFRQQELYPRNDWRKLKLPWHKPLNQIVAALSNTSVQMDVAFHPYKSMYEYLVNNTVLFFCNPQATLDWAVSNSGLFPNCTVSSEHHNKSNRNYGTFNNETAHIIRTQFAKDDKLWKRFCVNASGGTAFIS